MLGRELITAPRAYGAFLDVDDTGCRFLAFSDRETPRLAGGDVPFPAGMDRVAGLEEAVYANPLMLADFGRVSVVLRGGRFMLLPGFVADDDLAARLFRTQYPVDTFLPPAELLVDDWEGLDARLVYEAGRDELSFLRRTFDNPAVAHPLTVLARYFAARRGGGGGSRTLLSVGGATADLVVLGPDRVLCANSFPVSGPMDAAYYALAVRQSLSLPPRDELMLAAPARTRAALTPVLRRGIEFVIPAVEPQAVLAASREIRSLPFPLKVAPFANL
ncbi:MAG: DUF3822 family protein [Muribaculaceae bacterium]|nr:DUF3822 family protein [Muribaculaceae bacterium]